MRRPAGGLQDFQTPKKPPAGDLGGVYFRLLQLPHLSMVNLIKFLNLTAMGYTPSPSLKKRGEQRPDFFTLSFKRG
jgi:hypothetical protein